MSVRKREVRLFEIADTKQFMNALLATESFRDFDADASVRISAKTGQGLEDLYEAVAEILRENRVYIDKVIPYRDAAAVARIRSAGQLLSEEYEENGIHVRAYVPRSLNIN